MISFKQLSSCLGLSVDSPEAVNLFSTCLKKSVVTFDNTFSKTYTCHDAGCEVHCNKRPERISSIHLYGDVLVGEDKKTFSRYGNELPFSISFDDTPNTVRQKLGEPVASGSDKMPKAPSPHLPSSFDWLRYQHEGAIVRFCFIKTPNPKLFRIDLQ